MEGFWIIATFAAGIIAALSLLVNAVLWLIGRREGRFMISRGIGSNGVDLILVEPSSNNIDLKTLTWEGNIWKQDKEGMICAENLGKRVAEMTRIVKQGITALANELPSEYFYNSKDLL